MLRATLPTIVLKFGSSVLQNSASLPIAVAEIYRHYREGNRVVAVVSAFDKVTDALCATAQTFASEPDPATLAALVSAGEIVSAAKLTLALHRAGVSAQVIDPRDIGLTAGGDDRGNAALSGLQVERLDARLAQTSVGVVPGFFAQSDAGGVSLLGRGGSDLTALYLAEMLHARCCLLKDVDGLYESDPASGGHPGRYVLADYATAANRAGPLIQAKALHFARERTLCLDIARVGSSRRTRIGEGPTILSRAPPARRVRVALLGLGNVGGAVLQYLNYFPQTFEVVAAPVRTPARHIARGVPAAILTDSVDEVFARRPEILIRGATRT